MPLQSTLVFGITSVETLDAAYTPGVSARDVTHAKFNVKRTYHSGSTPAITVLSEQTLQLADSGTINFAALPTTTGPVDAVGTRLKGLRIHNRGANPLVLDEGAANGYALPGGAAITVPAGGVAQLWWGDALATSAAGSRTLDWTFDDEDEADVTLLLGPPPA